MKIQELLEDIERTGKSDTCVVGWGRGMGHKGHMLLAQAVIIQAQHLRADPYFIVSRTVGKDDPIYPEEKLAIYRKVFPKYRAIFQVATDASPTLNDMLSNLAQQGYRKCVVVVGADQVKAFQYLVNPDKSGIPPYQKMGFQTMDVIKRQDVNDPAQKEEGPRATPMREVLLDPNSYRLAHPETSQLSDEQIQYAVWRTAMPSALSDKEVITLMNKAKTRMGAMNQPKTAKKLAK